MRKFLKVVLATAVILVTTSMISFAGEWKQDGAGWWYQNDDGSYPISSWKEIDGKQYYFDASGYMLYDTTTPDGYKVGSDGIKMSYITGDATGINIIMSPDIDPETPFVGFMFENKTDHDMIIYGKDALFGDNISKYYNRRLELFDQNRLEQETIIATINSITVKPKENKIILFHVIGDETRYHRDSAIWFAMETDGQAYMCRASYNDGIELTNMNEYDSNELNIEMFR